MTGTQTAALRLALGVLRQTALAQERHDRAAARERHAQTAIDDACRVESEAFLGDPESPCFVASDLLCYVDPPVTARILRARLALTIRALLRAERGDFGAWVCPVHRARVVFDAREDVAGDEWWCAKCRRWHDLTPTNEPRRTASIALPLWTLARAHGGRT